MPLEIARSRPGLRNLFATYDEDFRRYFAGFELLVDADLSLEVLLAYCFFRLEQGQRMALYCGARRHHRTDSDMTWNAIEAQHITRDAFKTFFANVYGAEIPGDLQEIIEPAEGIRDRLMHGRGLEEPQIREAISRVLYYAAEINRFLEQRGVGFKPFSGDLRGFVGRNEPLDRATSRWILKGMGFKLA